MSDHFRGSRSSSHHHRRPSSTGGSSVASSHASQQTQTPSVARGRIYRTIAVSGNNKQTTKWVTRDIAALDFLLGIPMEQESALVQNASQRLPRAAVTGGSKWWEKYTTPTTSRHAAAAKVKRRGSEDGIMTMMLEQPGDEAKELPQVEAPPQSLHSGGRRLDGRRDAVKILIPSSGFEETRTRQRSIARQAAIREWELQVAHGMLPQHDGTKTAQQQQQQQQQQHNGLLDNGRILFSARDNYPVGVFSVIKYEPKREEAAQRRQKLEARGGGGTQFVLPSRDWRGISYKALLPRVESKHRAFNRFLRPQTETGDNDDDGSTSSSSSTDSDVYVPGFLDDPEMVQGRNRNVVIGDRMTGCIVSSTIQFVNPEDLKADLNKQFRERFADWEPPKGARKYIGAKVVDGVYTLIDPTENEKLDEVAATATTTSTESRRPRQGSISSKSETKETIRMPPSLTLSKIRSMKQQALLAAVRADMEVSTVALACVYFERLCLDCRVDKTNRRLCFASCILLAAKINENHVELVTERQGEDEEDTSNNASDHTKRAARLISFARPTKKSNTIFASLLEFFTHDWSLSLKHLFAAEFGVFAALGFQLHATPSQVAFHYKRFMKVLSLDPFQYLGSEMYNQWQDCLAEEETRRVGRVERREARRNRKERKLLNLEFKLEEQHDNGPNKEEKMPKSVVESPTSRHGDKSSIRKLFNRFSLKRPPSMERLNEIAVSSQHDERTSRRPHKLQDKLVMPRSTSMPIIEADNEHSEEHADHIAIDIASGDDNDESSSSSFALASETEGLLV